MTLGEQDMGHVERVGGGWVWHTRAIPGPAGAFETGASPTEFEARRRVEGLWQTYLREAV